MVAVIENRAHIEGVVTNVVDHPGREGYLRVGLVLKKALDTDDYPNLARADEGNTIGINVRKEAAAKIVEGMAFSGTVRKAGGQEYFLV
jgi:hypothetical protein